MSRPEQNRWVVSPSGFAGGVPSGMPLGGVILSLELSIVSAFALFTFCSGMSCAALITKAADNPIANTPFQFLIKITTFHITYF